MHISNEAITFLVSIFGGGGIGGGVSVAMAKAYMHAEAKKALAEDILKLEIADEALHKRVNHIENDYVQCKYCDMQHANLKNTLEGIDHKLDILVEKNLR